MYNNVSELYDKRIKNYDDEYNELSVVKKDKLNQKLKPINLERKVYDYDECFAQFVILYP